MPHGTSNMRQGNLQPGFSQDGTTPQTLGPLSSVTESPPQNFLSTKGNVLFLALMVVFVVMQCFAVLYRRSYERKHRNSKGIPFRELAEGGKETCSVSFHPWSKYWAISVFCMS